MSNYYLQHVHGMAKGHADVYHPVTGVVVSERYADEDSVLIRGARTKAEARRRAPDYAQALAAKIYRGRTET